MHEHTKKVHECVGLLRPLIDALLVGDTEKIDELQALVSKTEHEADIIKTELRGHINKQYFLAVGQNELNQFLTHQDDIADATEDFAIMLTLRKTTIPAALHEDFNAFVNQVIHVSEALMDLAGKLSTLAETAFSGSEVDEILQVIEDIGHDEWQADKLERKFARHFYSMEKELDPVTILFLDKYSKKLGQISNNAEKTAKYLRLIIRKK
jgi:predicted phosphate transport protein (TIGR00153 family)